MAQFCTFFFFPKSINHYLNKKNIFGFSFMNNIHKYNNEQRKKKPK